MTHGHAHEEAEHASHHSHDPFDKRVALTIMVVAGLLAGVKLLAHRWHNETLIYQIKAGVYQGKANSSETASANQWAFFQSKKMRELMSLQEATLLYQSAIRVTGKEVPLPDRDKRLADVIKELESEKVDEAAKVAEKIIDEADAGYRVLVSEVDPRSALSVIAGRITAARYRAEGVAIQAKARKEKEKADEYTKKAEEAREISGRYHDQAGWFDIGELGVDLAIVLLGVAILSKQKIFWFSGMLLAVAGLVVVLIGFTQ